jgi:hypothetical protein
MHLFLCSDSLYNLMQCCHWRCFRWLCCHLRCFLWHCVLPAALLPLAVMPFAVIFLELRASCDIASIDCVSFSVGSIDCALFLCHFYLVGHCSHSPRIASVICALIALLPLAVLPLALLPLMCFWHISTHTPPPYQPNNAHCLTALRRPDFLTGRCTSLCCQHRV